MQKSAATLEEEHIMSKYYEVCKYKNEDQVLYRTKLEKLALGVDWNTVQTAKSDNFIERYKEFYLYTIEESYKAEVQKINNEVQLPDEVIYSASRWVEDENEIVATLQHFIDDSLCRHPRKP